MDPALVEKGATARSSSRKESRWNLSPASVNPGQGLEAWRQRETRATTRLYLITPPALDPDRFAKELEEALAGGDVASLQLRLKDCDDDTVRRAARVLKPIAQDRGVAFIMNDRPDLAAELDCDGVHVGEEDMPYAEARRLLGPDRIVGVTCGASRDRAITAAEAGADYVAFGAFFPSTTKAAKHHADPELAARLERNHRRPVLRDRRHHARELRAPGRSRRRFPRRHQRDLVPPQEARAPRSPNSTRCSPATGGRLPSG